MARHDPERARAIAELEREFRNFGNRMAFLEQVFAERLGLNRTDLHVLGLLQDAGSMTAGDVAEATSLTTGAVTAVIDRLEKSGYARRERVAGDRRRVVVRPTHERLFFRLMLRRSADMYAGLSEQELEKLTRFLRRARPMIDQESAKLRGDAVVANPIAAPSRDFSVPLGSATSARLEIGLGASRLQLLADPSIGDLFRAHFAGRAPAVAAEGGTVAITYARFSALDWQEHAGTVALNGSMTWAIAVRGGVSKLTAELGSLQLRSLEVRGGASDVAVSLPRPSGTVRVAFHGGASRVALHRPPGVAARMRIGGGGSNVAFDVQRLGAVRGETVLQSPDYATAEDRYDITVSGGASQLAVQGGLESLRAPAEDPPLMRRDAQSTS
jgi:DNA-binding MarR family transcriptional regulator